jgi:hypothetical protein
MADIVIEDEIAAPIVSAPDIQPPDSSPPDKSNAIADKIAQNNEQIRQSIREAKQEAEDTRVEPKQDPFEWKKRIAQTKDGSISNRTHKHSKGSPDREKDDQEYRSIKGYMRADQREWQRKTTEVLSPHNDETDFKDPNPDIELTLEDKMAYEREKQSLGFDTPLVGSQPREKKVPDDLPSIDEAKWWVKVQNFGKGLKRP